MDDSGKLRSRIIFLFWLNTILALFSRKYLARPKWLGSPAVAAFENLLQYEEAWKTSHFSQQLCGLGFAALHASWLRWRAKHKGAGRVFTRMGRLCLQEDTRSSLFFCICFAVKMFFFVGYSEKNCTVDFNASVDWVKGFFFRSSHGQVLQTSPSTCIWVYIFEFAFFTCQLSAHFFLKRRFEK